MVGSICISAFLWSVFITSATLLVVILWLSLSLCVDLLITNRFATEPSSHLLICPERRHLLKYSETEKQPDAQHKRGSLPSTLDTCNFYTFTFTKIHPNQTKWTVMKSDLLDWSTFSQYPCHLLRMNYFTNLTSSFIYLLQLQFAHNYSFMFLQCKASLL